MKKQKFFRGHRVHITANLPKSMSHFTGDVDAIVDGSYSDQYGGSNVDDYSLLLLTKRPYRVSWYHEHQLTLVNSDRDAGERLLQKYKNS